MRQSVPDQRDTSATDADGRPTADTLSGGASAGAVYDDSATWFGPVSVTESDGSLTRYTYNAMGEVASKTAAGDVMTFHSVHRSG